MAGPALLNWGIANSDPTFLATQAEAVAHGERPPMAVDREWMDIILKSDADKMKDMIKIFTDGSKELEDRLLALEELQNLVESIDNANDLNKVGGLVSVVEALQDPAPEIQTYAAWVLGTCMQNNPETQFQVLANKGLPSLVSLLNSTTSPNVRGKVLNAISALVRSNQSAMEEFRHLDGFSALLRVLESKDDASKLRLVHMLTQFASSFSFVKDVVRETGLFQALLEMLKQDDLDLREKCLAALETFVMDCPQNLAEFKKRRVHERLIQLQRNLPVNEDNEEIHATLRRLISALTK